MIVFVSYVAEYVSMYAHQVTLLQFYQPASLLWPEPFSKHLGEYINIHSHPRFLYDKGSVVLTGKLCSYTLKKLFITVNRREPQLPKHWIKFMLQSAALLDPMSA